MRIKLFSVAITATLAAGLVTASPAQAADPDVARPGSESAPSIIGGETVSSAPWGVQVSSSSGSFCSGSISATTGSGR